MQKSMKRWQRGFSILLVAIMVCTMAPTAVFAAEITEGANVPSATAPAAQPEATPAAQPEATPAAQPEATPAETPEAAPNAPMAASARTAAVPAQDNAKGANAGGFSKPTAETLDSHHLVIALYTGAELPSEPALQYGGYLYSNSQNILAGGGPNTDPQYGDSYSCGARCHSQKASDVLTSAVLDKLVSNGKRVGEAVWGYPNAVGVGECLTDSFKSGAETALLQNYLSQNPQMAKPIDSYEIVWYVAKYQSNDWHWHLDGIVKEKSAYTVQYLLNAPAGEVTGNMPNGAKDIMAGASYTVQAGDANFARTGHQFAGWSTKADGTGAPLYQPGDVIANIGANISLYAQWNMISNRVSFGTQGNGTLEGEVQMDVPYGSQLPSVPTPKPGTDSVFTGWTENGKPVTIDPAAPVTGAHQYIANFAAKQAITLTANGNATHAYNGKEQSVTANSFTGGAAGLSYTLADGKTPLSAGAVGTDVAAYPVHFNAKAEDVRVWKNSVDVTNQYPVTLLATGALTITKCPVTIKANDKTGIYNGKALMPDADGYRVNGFVGSDGVQSVALTGSQLATGTSSIKVSYVLQKNTKEGNYNIQVTDGTLTVTKRPVTIAVNSAKRAYNGEPLLPSYTVSAANQVSGFIGSDGFESVALKGSQLFAGTCAAEVESYRLNAATAPDNYEIIKVPGRLEVTNIESERSAITFTTDSTNKVYDGLPLTQNTYKLSGSALHTGDAAEVSVNGTATNAFDTAPGNNTFSSVKIWHTAADGTRTEVTDYYAIHLTAGTLTVTQRALTLKGNTGSFVENGSEQAVIGFKEVNGLANGFTIGASQAKAARANVGTTAMGLSIGSTYWVKDANGNTVCKTGEYIKNYKITGVTDGYITITAAPVVPVTPPTPNPPTPTPDPPKPNPNPTTPVNPRRPVTPPTTNNPIAPVVTTPTEEPAANTPAAKPAEQPPQEEVIVETQTPLAADAPAWALLNLLLLLFTAMGSIALFVTYFTRKKQEEQDDNMEDAWAQEDAKAEIQRHGFVRIASLIPSLGALILFVLTENMRNPMVFVDKWTIVMVLIALVQIVAMALAKKKYQDEENDSEFPQPPANA